MKCNECRSVCHVDCNTRLPIPCVATAQTPFNKSFFGTVPLESVVPNVSPMVPAIIIRCIEEIEHRGLSDVGICGGNEQENEIKDLKVRNFFLFVIGKCIQVQQFNFATGSSFT